MFARACQTVYVCLRCQARSVARDQPWLSTIGRGASVKRLQSTAAAQIEDEEGYDVPVSYSTAERPTQDDSREDLPKTRQKRRKTRTFRPSASLGVPALGKDAEVLILPSRERRIPLVPTDADDKPKEHVQDILDSSAQPLSAEQVKSNIEHVKIQAGQGEEELDQIKWKQMRAALTKGFTYKQLFTYASSEKDGLPNHLAKPGTKRVKYGLARHIATTIWGFKLPVTAEEMQEAAPKQASGSLKVDKKHIEALFLDKSQPFRELSERHNVKVDVFQERSKVSFTGESAAINAAQTALRALDGKVQKTLIKLDKAAQSIISQGGPASGEYLLQSLQKKYGVVLTRLEKDKTLEVTHLDHRAPTVGQIHRELQMAVDNPTSDDPVFSWPRARAAERAVVPFHTTQQLSWSHQHRQWDRRILQRSAGPIRIPKLAGDQRVSFDVTSHVIGEALSTAKLQAEYLALPGIRDEYSAQFGQVLFERSGRKEPKSRTKTSSFVADIPLLPYFLARRRSWQSETEKAASSLANPSGFVARCSLAPLSVQDRAPSIELLLTGDSLEAGFKQPLRVAQVSLVFDEKRQALSLPSSSVDVTFKRQTKLDAFLAHEKRAVTYPALLKQLATYLNQAQGSESANFAPFVKVNMPKDLLCCRPAQIDTASEANKKSLKAKSKTKSAKATKNTGKVEYMLQSAETVDVETFHTPMSSGYALDHILYNGGRWGPDRQELRLGQRPFLYAPPSEKDWKFHTFFTAALDVATRLGDPALLARSEEESV